MARWLIHGTLLATAALAWPAPLPAGGATAPVLAYDNGDTNGDLDRDISDGIYLLGNLFLGGPAPVPLALCAGDEPLVSNGDTNGDGAVDVSDAVHLLRWLYGGGSEPVSGCGPLWAEGDGGARRDTPRIVPPRLFERIYAALAEKWWLWAFLAPASAHPLFDETGALCDVGQSAPVWFLAGSFVSATVERTCAVPAGRFIFFPLLNTECSSLEPEPFACNDRSECLECNDKFYSAEDSLSLTVDGVDIQQLGRFRVQSRLFEFTLQDDNIFGTPAGTRGVSLADGYYILIAPLSRGEHTIHWSSSFTAGPLAGFGGVVTYHLLVE